MAEIIALSPELTEFAQEITEQQELSERETFIVIKAYLKGYRDRFNGELELDRYNAERELEEIRQAKSAKPHRSRRK